MVGKECFFFYGFPWFSPTNWIVSHMRHLTDSPHWPRPTNITLGCMVEVGSMICDWLRTESRQTFRTQGKLHVPLCSTDTEWEAVASNGDVDGAHELIQRLLEDPDTKSQVTRVTACVQLFQRNFNRYSCSNLVASPSVDQSAEQS